jgi:uncharacterized protein (TIGR04552 family)
MRRDVLETDAAAPPERPQPPITPQDVEAVRLLLAGASVIDWQRVGFESMAEVDHFLSMHLLDMHDPVDRERIRYVYNEAVSYLEEAVHIRFPAELRNPSDVRDVFLWASQSGGFRRRQILSCVILKLMHVIHHMEAADLRFKIAMSEEQILDLAEARILEIARQMRESGLALVSFYGSRKTRSSIVTKLLAKKENLAATVFDKLRYRMVVERHSELLPSLVWMCRNFFPFNYVIPGQSHNNLVDPDLLYDMANVSLQSVRDEPVRAEVAKNEFSGASYKSINFIFDFPVKLPNPGIGGFGFELGRVVYIMVEMQILDAVTARTNEEGENSHHLYKDRQLAVVNRRLKRGRRGSGQF